MKVLVATSSTADDRKTLAAVRGLGQAGIEVAVGSDSPHSMPLYSRYCRKRLAYHNPAADMDKFIGDLRRHIVRGGYDVLLPLCDYTTTAMARNEACLREHAGLSIPPWQNLAEAHDKFLLAERASKQGIRVPQTHAPTTIAEVQVLAKTMDYPCVVKLRRGAAAIGLRFVKSPAELLEAFDRNSAEVDHVYDFSWPIIQEYIPGEIHDVCLLFNRGQVRAAVTQRRLKMYPIGGGLGIYNETTDEPELRRQAIDLLAGLNWHGPAQVEFKMDSRDGQPRLIEVNGRYWGTLDLSIQAGVNFPLLAARLAVEGDICPVSNYKIGLRYRWPFPYAVKYARQSSRPWRDFWEILKPGRNTCSDIRFSDPLPHLVGLWYRRASSGPATAFRP